MCRMPYTPAANAVSRIALALEPRCHSSTPRFCVYTSAQRGAALILMMADIIYTSPCMIEWRPSWCACSGRGTPTRNITDGGLGERHCPWGRKEAEIPDQTLMMPLSMLEYPTFGGGGTAGGEARREQAPKRDPQRSGQEVDHGSNKA
ncbi:hypothetical protein COCC4DRAFT_55610 [Bipolaris maydis ATCC 48331]|uniref:Uncharacterized protein n=2 Tax=Cochliobolus heterostrophus TaxID=5016 RepID=M2UBZ5_COCH5|nr:uncharacterized protein COCC4DRAFT_55610 [Bipolaris maydis ATCC 48331]EMD96089.1 hypothetical protein COCHEDRAFT_1152168 [Bipolaris maydis C5]ENI10949.1 hypothetical protein COCC4DRAFT_55610 [Bipolaris maydis ATCC 48331]